MLISQNHQRTKYLNAKLFCSVIHGQVFDIGGREERAGERRGKWREERWKGGEGERKRGEEGGRWEEGRK